MDVEMQMETNGLPTQFGSTSDQPQEQHIADNLAASISNSEASLNHLPPKTALTELPSQPEPELVDAVMQIVPETVAEAVPSTASEAVAAVSLAAALPPTVNGTKDLLHAVTEKPNSVVPDSQPQPTLPNLSVLPEPTSASDSNLTESFVPSSIPAEIQSSATLEMSQSAMNISEPPPAPSQAPTSDLRTLPHADALTPEAVAEIEAQKHELDNAADAAVTPSNPDVMDSSFISQPFTESAAPAEPAPVTNIGLPSPPAQSPSPAQQPTSTIPPEDKPVATAVEPAKDQGFVSASVEEPKEPAPTPALPVAAEPQDELMIDVLVAPTKQAREREEDAEDIEPSAKRIKTDAEADFKVPEVPAASASSPSVANGDPVAGPNGVVDGDDSVTPARLAHMKKVISNLKKSNASQHFRLPVDWHALNIPNYPEIIKQPMDLGTIDQRLKQNKYTSVLTFITDFELIVNNCFKFNGPDHGVSQFAKKMQSSFNSQMLNLPKATIEEPSKEVKKAAKKTEPTRTAPPRRPSVSTSTVTVGAASSPKSAVAPPTPSFALSPDGVPLIRRDSNMADGRPKRAIVPTKRNQDIGGGRPKKKKYELELKFCDEALKEISNPKHWQLNQYFTHPVDPVALNIPTYYQIIKKPMDLGTVRNNLHNNVYEKAKDFEEDVRLVFKNCYKFNPDGDLVNASGHQLEELFQKKWDTKAEWIAAREPASEPQSDADDDDEEEQESEEEEEEVDSEAERNDKIKKLQEQIAEMSKQMGELTQKKSKKSKSPPTKKSKSKPSKKEKPAATAPTAGKDNKKEKKKKPAAKPKAEKYRFVSFAEKQYISNGIAMLPEAQMQQALKIIQTSVPSLANSDQNEIELDIEEVPNEALLKLLNFVKKYAGPPPDEPKAEQPEVYNAPAVPKNKKSKPMSKHEQEAQIEELKGKLGAYAGPVSPNAVPSIEDGDSSDDDGDSEESEEE